MLYQLSYQGYAEIHVNLLKFNFQKRKNKDDKIVCDYFKQDTGFEPGTPESTVWRSINWATGARQNFKSISWNLSFKRENSKIIKSLVITISKTRYLNLVGPLAL